MINFVFLGTACCAANMQTELFILIRCSTWNSGEAHVGMHGEKNTKRLCYSRTDYHLRRYSEVRDRDALTYY